MALSAEEEVNFRARLEELGEQQVRLLMKRRPTSFAKSPNPKMAIREISRGLAYDGLGR